MENRWDFGRRIGLLCFLFSVFILFQCTTAENRTYPEGNVNLSPFQAWRSAHWCMLNFRKNNTCTSNNMLTEQGVLVVSPGEEAEFCKAGGCADQTRAVLSCIHHVKRGYFFMNPNGITLNHIYNIIKNACPSSSP
ncbi:unnamed protein product [Camellia sinensis]